MESEGTPRISVLLPVYNASETLDEALESLWKQRFRNFEVLAVDDGSTDGSADILARHGEHELRLRTLRSEHLGLVPALNLALTQSQAPFLARMDADDRSHPDRLELQLTAMLHNPKLGVVGTKVHVFPRGQVQDGWKRYQTWINGLISPQQHAREIFVESPLAHPSVLIRREALDAVGGYQDPPWPEDYDLWLRMHLAGWELAKVNRVLLAWRHSGSRESFRSSRYNLESFMATRCHYLARHPALRQKRVRIWGAGKTGRRLARGLEGQGIAIEAFYEVAPKLIGKLRRNVPVRFWKELGPPDAIPLLVAVGAPGARDLIRPHLDRLGYMEGETAFFVS